LTQLFSNYFRERETNFEHRSEIFKQLFNHAKRQDLEAVRLNAEMEALRLRDAANVETIAQLSSMFEGDGEEDMTTIHNQLKALNDRYSA
jgi:hypothetical protein